MIRTRTIDIPAQRVNDNQEREVSHFWLNVGYVAPNGKFVSLPLGIPLDNLKPKDIPAPTENNLEFRQMLAAQNDLLKEILAACTMEPGKDILIDGLECQLRRRQEKTNQELSKSESEENPFKRPAQKTA